jgi:serine/threonine protein kinase
MIGKTVSHYKILEKLGEGGMGVVYKAEDLKLTRTIALKFLPHGLDANEPERARFLQEARAAAILNHPNICTIYDIQEHEGQQFILMEYVEGKTLREILPVKKMQETIGYAIQIAEALEEAHTKGIVHRDIKAENIMVNSKNQVKVMDFGLAKLKGSLKLTKTSSTIGTLAYMAPEQIQSEEVDARSDIFSFGIVLYEMLTGHLPFRGEHEAAMMYSIVNEEPEPLQHHVPDAPSELLHILDRALEKDREDRYQSAHDMLIDLRRLKKDSGRVIRKPSYDARAAGTPPQKPEVEGMGRRKTWLWIGATSAFILCVLAVFMWMQRTPPVRLDPNRTTLLLKTSLKDITSLGLSRDGNWVVFSAQGPSGKEDVYWMNIAGGRTNRITEESSLWIDGTDPSPDASQVVYAGFDEAERVYKVKVVSTLGGASRTVADSGIGPRWRPDGQRIAYIRMGRSGEYPSPSGKLELWSVKPDGTDRHREVVDSSAARPAPWAFSWSPDGKSMAWVRTYPEDYAEIAIGELASGAVRMLTSDRKSINDLTWATNDQIFFPSNRSGVNNLWMIPAGGGEAVQVTQGGAPIREARISGDNRTLVVRQTDWISHIWTSALDGSNPRQLTSEDVRTVSAVFSPDAREIAYVTASADLSNPEAHLYIMDRDGKNPRQLTSGPEVVSASAWSPDGKHLAFTSRLMGEPPDSMRVSLIRPLDPEAPRVLCAGQLFGWVSSEQIVVYHNARTLLYSISGDTPSPVYEDSTFARPLQKSNQLVILDRRQGREGWWLVSPGGHGRAAANAMKLFSSSAEFAPHPEWRFLIYTKQGEEIWQVSTSNGKERRIGTALPGLRPWDVSRDGREILWLDQSYPSKLVVIKNAFE